MICLLENVTGLACTISILHRILSFPFVLIMNIVWFSFLWQKRWSGATFSAGEACDRLNATHRSKGKDYYMGYIWFSWPTLSGFRITQHSSEWKDGISLLRRTSYQSGAPWCTEPPLGSLPRATALYSMPVTSRRENITPRTYQWLPTQVSQTYPTLVLSHKNVADEMLFIPTAATSIHLKAGCLFKCSTHNVPP